MAKHGKLQTNLEYIAAKVLLSSLGKLPMSLAISVGQGFGNLAYRLAGNLRRTGQRNLQLAFPEKTEAERDEIIRGTFQSLGRQLGVFSKFANSPTEDLYKIFKITGLEHYDELKAQNKSVVFFTAHLGAWELLPLCSSLRGNPLNVVVRRLDNPKVEELVEKIRARWGNQTLDKLSAGRQMIKVLRSGEDLGLLTDLNVVSEEAIFVDFFGVPAATNFMVAKLALRTKAPIVPMFAPWDKTLGKYDLQVSPPVELEPTGDEEADVHNLTAKLSKITEDKIRDYPDQWLWIHKRWKTRPPGEPSIY
ncbi:MAG TPA: lysophospholipid acyltransferase family protein [Pyrinomonadaceae bacterium]